MRSPTTALIASAYTFISCSASQPTNVGSTTRTTAPLSSAPLTSLSDEWKDTPLSPVATAPAIDWTPQPSTASSAPLLAAHQVQVKRERGCSNHPEGDLARGRKLASSGRWEQALAVYDPAVRKRPGDATLRAERGLALYKLGEIALAEADWLLGTGLTETPSILGALHYNLGLLYDSMKKPEEARLHLAYAEALGNKAAGRRLGDASRCRVTWTVAPDVSPAPIAFSLRELLGNRRFVSCSDLPEVSTEQEAAAWLCRSCSYGEFGNEDCVLTFPLEATDGTRSFAIYDFFAEKLPGKSPRYLYFYSSADQHPIWKAEGEWLAIFGSEVDAVDLNDGLGSTLYATPDDAYTYTEGDSSDIDAKHQSCVPEYDGAASGPAGMAGPSPLSGSWRYPIAIKSQKTVTIYSMKSREPRLLIKSFGGEATVRLDGNQVIISGLGCNETLPLSD